MSLLFRAWPALLAAALLAACAAPQPRQDSPRQVRIPPPRVSVIQPAAPTADEPDPGPASPFERDGPPDPDQIPADLLAIPEPVPQAEPLSASGNPDNYEVFGQKYNVLATAQGYREIGLASWYGKKFHGRKTSSGERYDMFKLTAAHKSLPLPTYVRVTNLSNGKSVIVRVNDRGPFHSSRIIDLSYAAAAKLDTIGKIATVELEAITPGRALPPAPRLQTAPSIAATGKAIPRMLQVAAYSDPVNAVNMREELREQGFDAVQVRTGQLNNGDTVHRVMVGPFDERQRMDEMRIRIRGAGYEAFPVAE